MGQTGKRRQRVWGRSDIGYPVDAIAIATERFEATKDIIGGFAYPAHQPGEFSMKPPENIPQLQLVLQWLRKADEDLGGLPACIR